MTAAMMTIGCAIGAAALAPVMLRLAEATAHGPTIAATPLRVVAAAVLGAFGAAAGAWLDVGHAIVVVLVVVLAGAAALVDVVERRLPDPLTGPLAATLAVGIAVAIALGNPAGVRALWAFGAGVLLAVAGKVLHTESVGWGDVKLAPSLAACLGWSGWPTVYIGLLAWSALILATAVIVWTCRGRAALVPYGPAMVIGTALAVVITG